MSWFKKQIALDVGLKAVETFSPMKHCRVNEDAESLVHATKMAHEKLRRSESGSILQIKEKQHIDYN